jgi:hypothetical protein
LKLLFLTGCRFPERKNSFVKNKGVNLNIVERELAEFFKRAAVEREKGRYCVGMLQGPETDAFLPFKLDGLQADRAQVHLRLPLSPVHHNLKINIYFGFCCLLGQLFFKSGHSMLGD